MGKLVGKSVATWLLLIAAEIVHGIARGFLLVPFAGDLRSRQIGVFTGSVIILAVAWWVMKWIGPQRKSALILVGAIWLILTVAFEILFGRFVMDMSWERIGADYDLTNGGFMPIGLLVLLLAPLLVADRSAISSQ